MLSCHRFKGRHTGENIFDEYENIVSTFKISSKVKHVITDNASNMLKAFWLFESPNQDPSGQDDSHGEDDIDENVPETVDSDELDLLPVEHHGCFAYSLQLVIKDGFKEAGQIIHIVSKCSRLVSHVCKSTIANEIME